MSSFLAEFFEPDPVFRGVPYDLLVSLEEAIRILEDYKFGPLAQNRLIGLPIDQVFETVWQQREAAYNLSYKNWVFWYHVWHIKNLYREITLKVGPKIEDHLFWLATEPKGEARCYRDMLEQGTPRDVELLSIRLPGEADAA